jgi:hypothetical protein
MNKSIKNTLYLSLPLALANGSQKKIYRALAKNRDLALISILPNTYGLDTKVAKTERSELMNTYEEQTIAE